MYETPFQINERWKQTAERSATFISFPCRIQRRKISLATIAQELNFIHEYQVSRTSSTSWPPFFLTYLPRNASVVSQFIPLLWQRHGYADFYLSIWKQNMSNASLSNVREMRGRDRGKNFMVCRGQLLFNFEQENGCKLHLTQFKLFLPTGFNILYFSSMVKTYRTQDSQSKYEGISKSGKIHFRKNYSYFPVRSFNILEYNEHEIIKNSMKTRYM